MKLTSKYDIGDKVLFHRHNQDDAVAVIIGVKISASDYAQKNKPNTIIINILYEVFVENFYKWSINEKEIIKKL